MPAPITCHCETCEKCIDRLWFRRKRRLVAYGQWQPWTDPEPARAHARELQRKGMSIERIAQAAGVNGRRISALIYGRAGKPLTKTRPEFAAAVLAIEVYDRLIPHHRVSRRLGALVALGYSQRAIEARLGYARPRGWELMHLTSPVTRETFENVDRLYRELCMTPAPRNTTDERRAAAYAVTTARKNGWVHSLAWDDIDDPDEKPTGVFTGTLAQRQGPSRASVDHARVERILAGEWTLAPEATRAERAAVLARWPGTLNDLERLSSWRVDRYHLPNGAA